MDRNPLFGASHITAGWLTVGNQEFSGSSSPIETAQHIAVALLRSEQRLCEVAQQELDLSLGWDWPGSDASAGAGGDTFVPLRRCHCDCTSPPIIYAPMLYMRRAPTHGSGLATLQLVQHPGMYSRGKLKTRLSCRLRTYSGWSTG